MYGIYQVKREFNSKSEVRRARILDLSKMTDEEIDDAIITLEHTDKFFRTMHSIKVCKGQPCTIHNRTDHHMRHMPQSWRGDRAIMERICEHGVGHPDPDEREGIDRSHGCDMCCWSGK
jgi:hypothetical protein